MDVSHFRLGWCSDRGACAKWWNQHLFIVRAHASTVDGLFSTNKYLPAGIGLSSVPNSALFISSTDRRSEVWPAHCRFQLCPPRRVHWPRWLPPHESLHQHLFSWLTRHLLLACLLVDMDNRRTRGVNITTLPSEILEIMIAKVMKTSLTPLDDIVSLYRS
jgi:hypothetical protein